MLYGSETADGYVTDRFSKQTIVLVKWMMYIVTSHILHYHTDYCACTNAYINNNVAHNIAQIILNTIHLLYNSMFVMLRNYSLRLQNTGI